MVKGHFSLDLYLDCCNFSDDLFSQILIIKYLQLLFNLVVYPTMQLLVLIHHLRSHSGPWPPLGEDVQGFIGDQQLENGF